jgi:hypothetical protein
MEAYMQYIINYAIESIPLGVYDEEDYEEWRENEFNSVLKEVPDNFNVDWIDVINYIAKYEEDNFGVVSIDFPINKKLLYNTLNYFIISTNEDIILKNNK